MEKNLFNKPLPLALVDIAESNGDELSVIKYLAKRVYSTDHLDRGAFASYANLIYTNRNAVEKIKRIEKMMLSALKEQYAKKYNSDSDEVRNRIYSNKNYIKKKVTEVIKAVYPDFKYPKTGNQRKADQVLELTPEFVKAEWARLEQHKGAILTLLYNANGKPKKALEQIYNPPQSEKGKTPDQTLQTLAEKKDPQINAL